MYIIIVSIFGTLGIAMMFQIIKYLKSKPLGFQTLMDSLYIQLIQYWVLESSLTFVTIILIQIQENNWILAWLVGFGTYLAMLLSSIHLLICLIFQILLIWYQSIFDPFEDGKILKYIRYKFKINELVFQIWMKGKFWVCPTSILLYSENLIFQEFWNWIPCNPWNNFACFFKCSKTNLYHPRKRSFTSSISAHNFGFIFMGINNTSINIQDFCSLCH